VTIRDDIVANVPRLRRYAKVLLRDPVFADDLVQDVLERALSRLHLFKPGTNLRAWLFTIMHNMHVNQAIRAGKGPRTGSDDDVAESHQTAVAPAQTAGLRDMERALATLPEEQRAVVLLVGVEGLTYAETAAALEVPVGTVMSRLARGRQRLRTYMNGEDPAPDGAGQ
jgi:RNA polymerase sigma-70 factor, ECF subfamily